MTFAGTRPELIRLSQIIPKLDQVCDHKFVYLGQNYDKNLKDIFFDDLNIRKPDDNYKPEINTTDNLILSAPMFTLMFSAETSLREFNPDKVLILGDTNSSLAATIIAEKMGIPVFHMEAGNRCWDKRVPEEVNRQMIDSIASYNMPYTEKSAQNLYREGHHPSKVFVSGNPIYEVYRKNYLKINSGAAYPGRELRAKFKSPYVLATFHRQENVDVPENLLAIVESLIKISKKFPVIVSTHPRTKDRMENEGYNPEEMEGDVQFLDPFNFTDFMYLEKMAQVIITDSGTVQEEAAILGVPCVTIRSSTERPETVEVGANIITGLDKENIVQAFKMASEFETDWYIPNEYDRLNVSQAVVNYILGNHI